MLVVQTVLLKKCFEIENAHVSDKTEPQAISGYDPVDRLHGTLSKMLTGFIIYFFLFIFYKCETLTAVTGSLSAAFEACLPLPQFISNFRNKSVESVR